MQSDCFVSSDSEAERFMQYLKDQMAEAGLVVVPRSILTEDQLGRVNDMRLRRVPGRVEGLDRW